MIQSQATSTPTVAHLAAIACCFGALLAAANLRAGAETVSAVGNRPAGYELIVAATSFCLSNSGDVVEPNDEWAMLTCPKGYEWLAHLCFSPATGDVVFASERGSATQSRSGQLADAPKQ